MAKALQDAIVLFVSSPLILAGYPSARESILIAGNKA